MSICHLTTLITRDDLLPLYDAIHLFSDTLTIYIRNLSDRLLPEKSNVLCTAFYALKELNSTNIPAKEEDVLKFLLEIFSLNTSE